MLSVSRATVLERWQLFIGAVLSVALGVALVQSALLLLLTAATAPTPEGASALEVMALAAQTTVAVTVLAVTLAFAAFLAFFIIGTTFAFTVDQRERDLALLRLVGASPRQVRRLLVGEAALLGVVGTVIGVPLGVAVMAGLADLLAALGFVPSGFAGRWQWWVLGVSVLMGVGLAVSGVLLAAKRATAIAPLAALRDGETTAPVMTRGRWIVAGIFGAGTIALLVIAPLGGAAGGQAMAMNVSIVAAIALTAATPLLVPLAARLVPARGAGVPSLLARSSLRDNVRRSASTAAPLVVLIGILVGQATALPSFAAAGVAEQRRAIVADYVLESDIVDTTTTAVDTAAVETAAARIAAVPGVASASTEVTVPAEITTGRDEMAFTELGTVTVVDPVTYAVAHPDAPALDALTAGTAASGPSAIGVATGDDVDVRIGDADLGALEIVAESTGTMTTGPTLLLPVDAVPSGVLAGSTAVSFVSVEAGADTEATIAALAAFGEVAPLDEWLDRTGASGATTAASILIVVLGLGSLYALIGVVNAVVIAAATRRHEFAVARASGLTRGQVVGVALLESSIVTAIGVALGLLAAAGTIVATAGVTAAVAGVVTLVVPWPLIAAVVVGAFLVTGVTSVLTTRAATSEQPVMLLRSRE